MAEMFQFDLVSPERRLVTGQATEVQLAGTDGNMTVMAGHAPTITTLRPGVLRVKMADGSKEFAVTGGFADIGASVVTVLAEQAVPLAELDRATIDKMVADASAERDHATAEQLDTLGKRVTDIAAMAAEAGH